MIMSRHILYKCDNKLTLISELLLSLKDLSDDRPLAAYKACIVHCAAQAINLFLASISY